MPSFFAEMGMWAYPMTVAGLFLLIQIGRGFASLGRVTPDAAAGARQSILALGALNAVLGVLGTAVGISLAAGIIRNATSLSPQVIAGGIKVALSTTVLGFLLFSVALVSWLLLRWLEGRKRPA